MGDACGSVIAQSFRNGQSGTRRASAPTPQSLSCERHYRFLSLKGLAVRTKALSSAAILHDGPRLASEDSMPRCSPPATSVQRRCESRPPEYEPVPHHTQDLNYILVRAYKRSCERVDPVIKIGRRSTFCAYRALTAGQPISAATAITLI